MVPLEAIARGSDFDIDPVSALRNPRRREVIFAFMSQQSIDSKDLVSNQLSRGDDTVDEIQGELTETHLPILVEAGFIEWDRETGMVSKGPRFEDIPALFDAISEDDRA